MHLAVLDPAIKSYHIDKINYFINILDNIYTYIYKIKDKLKKMIIIFLINII